MTAPNAVAGEYPLGIRVPTAEPGARCCDLREHRGDTNINNQKMTTPTGRALTALDPIFRENPHKYLDHLRSTDPVHQDREFDRVVVTRAEDVASILFDREMSVDPEKSRPGSFSRLQVGEKFERSMLLLDDPDHKRLRALVSKAFNQQAIEAMRPRIAMIANRLLDKVAGETRFDVVESYAKPLPTIVIAEMLGIREADQADFNEWSDGMVQLFNASRTAEQQTTLLRAKDALNSYFAAAIAERRQYRGDDLVSVLIEAEEDGDKLSEAEILTCCRLLLVAGNVTTTDLIGNGLLALLQHPMELAKLRRQPELVRDAVEEVLRYDPPIVERNRITTTSTQIGGCPMAAGLTITASLLAANHDPLIHTDPEKFDISRSDKRHYSFGGGTHFCLGAPLARAETQIALSLIIERFPGLHLNSDFAPVHRTLPSFNGLDSLWVEK
ncbi:cytochrome P450 [Granulicella mallensis]|uniref:Peroxidase n=1 Tax=Granulicella mallensis (strain ATCC BAA-1857 / DSM 23137 / MP5ACTX8) TaxID=682795 RepID=G8P0D8_GRAMM|nr:cytochrome P450 [Granulicella mallensis]AEU38026.1 Peroxidase [Granulicella mallensis MP5ACTX8]